MTFRFRTRALLHGVAAVLLGAHATALVSSARAQIDTGSELTSGLPVEPTSVAELGTYSGSCYSSPATRRPQQIPPAFWGSLGTYGRTWEARGRVAVEGQGDLTVGQFGFATSFSPVSAAGQARPRYEIPTLTIVVRAAGLGFIAPIDSRARLVGVHPSAGFIIRSRCDGYWLEVGARLLVPWSSDAQPETLRSAFRASMTLGVDDDAIILPIDHAGVQFYAGLTMRTVDFGPGLILGAEGRIVVSVGTLSIGTWLGSQRGFVGSSSLGLFLGVSSVNLRFGARAALSLTSIWPAGEVLPLSAEGYLRWSPFHALELEAFLGTAGPLQSTSGDGFRFRWGLALTGYVPDIAGH